MKKEVLNIVLINLTIFFALTYLHEISHLGIAFCLGCKAGKAVALDLSNYSTYTELHCPQGNNLLIYVGSMVISIAFGSLFIFLDKPTRNVFFLIVGFSLILSSLDLALAFGYGAFYASFFGGLLLLGFSEFLLASNSLDKTIYFQNKNF